MDEAHPPPDQPAPLLPRTPAPAPLPLADMLNSQHPARRQSRMLLYLAIRSVSCKEEESEVRSGTGEGEVLWQLRCAVHDR